ncbi:hypothetical protein Aple_037680 [Acrocarpospora pleiomorpha]|uniref:Uncharacterized protein n=1 Tax=Acrocarpospora pleiomorpha TaxID=90975 RepID=A0A5M3XJB8_9ACTN|nr:hypothetical protein [Acrocarpospora pleiomorpha]GES20872.1 hypothetical protein Aple_037680 [Acrocarpospora pleiomorpha]
MGRVSARRTLAAVLAGLFAAYLLYVTLHAGGVQQTALFYIGIPGLIAITVVLAARPRTATGLIMVTITIGLAVAGPLLREGIVCLLMAAPLFYLVGLVIGLAVDHADRRGRHLLVAPLILVAALEGTAAGSMPRANEVTVSVPALGDVETALEGEPRFGPVESRFLALGFPKPVRATGSGLDVGDSRLVEFTPRRSLGIGAPLEPRSLELRVIRRGPGMVVFGAVSDTTVARWLDLREAEFRWTPSRLDVTIRYRRTFDPSWYFGPLQRYAVAEAATYLAKTFAS